MSWDEYGANLRGLHDTVRRYLDENGVKVDALIPILRGGAFAGTYLAYRLRILTIVPLQYKYIFGDRFELRRLLGLPPEMPTSKDRPTLLLVENNHCHGTTAKAALEDLRKAAPGCSILYTAAYMDCSSRNVAGVQAAFYGRLTNETGSLSAEEAAAQGIPNEVPLFPWEDEEEELAMIEQRRFEYG